MEEPEFLIVFNLRTIKVYCYFLINLVVNAVISLQHLLVLLISDGLTIEQVDQVLLVLELLSLFLLDLEIDLKTIHVSIEDHP